MCHEGSVRFRKIIDLYRERYCSDETSKQERMNITKEIVARVSESSRFLKYDTKQKVWRTISALAARDKVSHALRFAHLKENRKTGKVKYAKKRTSAASAGSSGSPKTSSPEDTELWHSFVIRQTKLLESIKKGKIIDNIPMTVELPKPTTVTTVVSEGSTELDPLCINDVSFEETPVFQDYCRHLHRSEGIRGAYSPTELDNCRASLHDAFEKCEIQGSYQLQESEDSDAEDHERGHCLCEESCDGNSESHHDHSQACEEDDIASMITEPLMAWDLEHDGIFEV